MQRIATGIFITASVAFGIVGLLVILTLPNTDGGHTSDLHIFFMKLMFATVFVILPSFALSIAGKYLDKR